MAVNVEKQIQELQDAKSKHAELRGKIKVCDDGIDLLRKTRPDVKKEPWINISVKDNYKDDDNWASAEIVLHTFPAELTETLVKIFENEKKHYQFELDALERKYTF